MELKTSQNWKQADICINISSPYHLSYTISILLYYKNLNCIIPIYPLFRTSIIFIMHLDASKMKASIFT